MGTSGPFAGAGWRGGSGGSISPIWGLQTFLASEQRRVALAFTLHKLHPGVRESVRPLATPTYGPNRRTVQFDERLACLIGGGKL